jgi:hypothetical protein
MRTALLAIILALSACSAAPPPPSAPVATPAERPVAVLALPTATPAPTATPQPTPSPPTPTLVPSPTPDPWVPRVGLQVGHLNSTELPDELARFRTSTGARWGGVTEAELNYEIVQRVQPILEAAGMIVDVLPATVPPGYNADAFLAIHADGSTGAAPRGWKLATPWRASEASQRLLEAVAATYGPATGLPQDVGGVTANMRGYYAFSYRRHTHAIARTTPAIIVEMGFMTNAADREVLFGRPDAVARGIAEGVIAYFATYDPTDAATRTPPDLPLMRPLAGALVRAAPRDDARLLLRIEESDLRFVPFTRRGDWYEGVVRGQWGAVGWVHADQLVVTNEPLTFPTPTNP